MAGRGPAPKRPQDRARTNKDGAEWRVITMSPEAQPALEDVLGDVNPVTDEPWRPSSRTFWGQLGGHPTTRALLPAQWSSLARAVAYDEAALVGKCSASEARLRLAKFGIDPDDMLRLRVQVVAADEAERRGSAAKSAPSARERRGPLTSAG